MTRISPLVVACLALVATLLAGCGFTSGGGTPDSGSNTIPVTMKDTMTFEPASITVKTGQEVKIDLTNAGSIPHNFSIADLDVDETLEAGASTTVTFSAPSSPGQYRIVCAEPGHEEAGMVGTLMVER